MDISSSITVLRSALLYEHSLVPLGASPRDSTPSGMICELDATGKG